MDNFDLKKYLAEGKLMEELPKNKFIDLDKGETKEYKDEIFNLNQTAYKPIGGHVKYKSPDDVTGAEGDSDYEVADIDDDPEIDVVSFSSNTPFGTKLKGMGHDGEKLSKRTIIKHHIDSLKQGGHYLEASGRIEDILLDSGVPTIKDEELIKKILKGKSIEMNDDGSYQRYLGGQKHTKRMFGNI